MKTSLFLGVSLIGLLASVATASAVENEVRVVTSHSLQVAVVRIDADSPNWYVIQQAFAGSMSACLMSPQGIAMPVAMSSAEASDAADNLVKGACDAVLVLGERLPSDLRGAEFVSVRAVSQMGIPVHVFHLVMRSNDRGAVKALSVAFEKATSSAAFQDTVGRASSMRIVADARIDR